MYYGNTARTLTGKRKKSKKHYSHYITKMCLTVRHISQISIQGQAKSIYRSRAEVVAVFDAAIPGIALHGVDKAILHLFHDADVIGQAVALPVEKDNVAGARLIIPAFA